jgi:hypothetical protein
LRRSSACCSPASRPWLRPRPGDLENHQTEPDIKVMNEYEVMSKGRDQQLEAAVAALMKEIK